MATTNFLQWNNAAINQETDAQYLADSQRTGGAPEDGLAPSTTMNKFYYQVSTFVAAFGQMMANKGYSTSDADIAVLTAVLANIITESDQLPQLIQVGYSPTPVFNAASADGFQMALTGNITSSTITGVSVGQLLAFYFEQDSIGGRTVSFPPSFVGAIQPDPTPGAVSIQLFRAGTTGAPRAVTPVVSNNGIFTDALKSTSITATTGAFSGALNAATVTASGLVKAGSFTLSAPGSAGQILTNSGGVFIPLGTPTTNGANGSYRISPDGTIECWGVTNAAATGNQFSQATITFPKIFTADPCIQITAVGLPSPSAHANDIASPQIGSLTTSGAEVYLQCSTPEGGGGATFANTVAIHFYAIGK